MMTYQDARNRYMQQAREMKAQMQESGDKDHAALVYIPGIRRLVDMARGANYAEMLEHRCKSAASIPELLRDVRQYRDALTIAFRAGNRARFCIDPEFQDENNRLADRAWDQAHGVAHQLIDKYGTVTYARIDNLAHMYC